MRTDTASPIDWLQFPMIIYAERVSRVAAVEAEDLRGLSKRGWGHEGKKEKERSDAQ